MNRKKNGFTLIEMLLVIAIIAILVAMIIPTATNAVTQAKAATDAANLRSILAVANVELLESETEVAAAAAAMTKFDCKTFPGAKAYIYFVNPGFIIGYYNNNGDIYTVESFAKSAESGSTPVAVSLPAGGTAYEVGTGADSE